VESEGCSELTLMETKALTPGRQEKIPRDSVPKAPPRFERHGGCAGIFLWRARRERPVAPRETDEAIKKLRALGYLH